MGKIVCIECNEVIEEQEGIGGISHGMCKKCLKKIKRTVQEAKTKKG